ncbi:MULTISPECIES: dihydrolipoyl dehydrogenase family protein [Afipia]|uniref:Mercuric reductase n=2 Tax=Afipia felis TaxID=1035 RepID=A0A380W346_AFIFE|nr:MULTISPECIES: FAD-dependent oxidoreductase [Afipia]EFI53332.1 FAD-dependent pyridine nucleotide-disulfide oxidoreductase [Afipia sp. 1NLS2]EKS30479.1 hypothetical protein HMPREF9697_03007 [Afipia felis ATCC 53690]SUU75224.1 Mercuric reductase [Afipia felis]SUU83290.1 Mercuric reductase [Afipia felis]
MRSTRSIRRSTEINTDLCVIGAGSAGLTIAAGAVQMGARTVLIEAHRMGGDCLNTGCVPSKSFLAVAKLAHSLRELAPYSRLPAEARFDFDKVHGQVQSVIKAIAPNDSEERFTRLGCTVIREHARFLDRQTVEAAGQRIRARRIVIATGSRPRVPPIPGLDQVPYLTTETLFENTVLPQHLLIIGGGPVGTEMAQAHRRLGAEVTLLSRGALLPRDDPDAVDVLRQALHEDSVALHEFANELSVTWACGRILASFVGRDGARRELEASHVLVAAGRRPNIEGLHPEAADVRYSEKGIEVDARLRTSNRRIYAAGDVAGGPQFTHLAAYHAGIVLRNALFRLPAKANLAALPWVTYTDPELAQVGLTEAQAREAHGSALRVLNTPFADVDRAQTDDAQGGFAKILVTKRGRVVGATIVGRQAGELVVPWGLAVGGNLKIGALARVIVPYPSLSEITKRAASAFYTPALFSARTRWLVRVLGWFG